MAEHLQPIEWTGDAIRILDQTRLPDRVEYLDVRDVDGLVDAIVRLAIRGAPALGTAAAFGVALAMLQARRESWTEGRLHEEIERIRLARPTAVNLARGADPVLPLVPRGVDAVVAAATASIAADERTNRALSRNGADWIAAHVSRPRVRIVTHCNTGYLATTVWGTGLGIVRELHLRGALEVVYVDETRPLLQGSRLNAWELEAEGIPHLVQVDGAAAGTILGGLVDVAIVGADRIAANGDVANKVGTLGLALACADAGIPFLSAAPESTIDLGTARGTDIHVEQRDEDEVLSFGGIRVAPRGSRAHNPAFDVTPARLVTGIVTELGVLEPARGDVPGHRLGGAVRG